MTFGSNSTGHFPRREHFEHILIPLEAPSFINTTAATENGVFHGAVAPSTVNTYLFRVLGCAEPKHATAAVIMIGKRVVNVLYGHGEELTPLQLADVQEVCTTAAGAYARLIQVQKKKK